MSQPELSAVPPTPAGDDPGAVTAEEVLEELQRTNPSALEMAAMRVSNRKLREALAAQESSNGDA